MELRCTTPEEVPEIARRILDHLGDTPRVVLLEGDLGAGKTTLTQAFCGLLGSTDSATSPTFSLINVYAGRQTIYHIDLYRLQGLEEALGIGIEEYLYSAAWCFIEWPAIIAPILPAGFARIEIEADPDGTRIFRILKDSTRPNDE